MAVAPMARSLVNLRENMGILRFRSGGIQRASQFTLGVTQEEAGTFLRERRRMIRLAAVAANDWSVSTWAGWASSARLCARGSHRTAPAHRASSRRSPYRHRDL